MKVDQSIPGEGFSLKPTWDIIYRRKIIYPRHWPSACLQGWVEFTFAGASRRLSVMIYFMWTSSTDATTIRSIFTGGMVENCAHSICISCKFEYVGDPSQMRRGPTEQIAEHFQLEPATTSQVGRRDMRSRLYMGYIGLCGPNGYMVFSRFGLE